MRHGRFLCSLFFLTALGTAGFAQISFDHRSYPPIPGRMIIADFNGDGLPDLFGETSTGSYSDQFEIMLNNGDGTFQAPAFFPHSGFVLPAAADLNRNGRTDILGCYYQPDGTQQLAVWIAQQPLAFAEPVLYSLPGSCLGVVVSDFNGDGRPDVAVIFQGQVNSDFSVDGGIAMFFGDGVGGFTAGSTSPIHVDCNGGYSALSGSALAGDYDHDGHPDIVVSEGCIWDSTANWLVFGHGDGAGDFSFYQPRAASGDPQLRDDIDQDGWLDVVAMDSGQGPWGTSWSYIRFLNNQQTAAPTTWKSTLTYGYSCDEDYCSGQLTGGLAADINGDGIKDVVVSGVDNNYDSNGSPSGSVPYLGIFFGHTDRTYGDAQKIGVSDYGTIYTADLDRDGRADFVVQTGTSVEVFLNRTSVAPTCFADPVVRSVKACSPAQLSGNSLHLLANTTDGAPVTGMKVYVDNTMTFYSPNQLINRWLTFPNGGHRITVRAWDAQGSFSSARWINVNTTFGCSTPSYDRTIHFCFPTSSSTVGNPLQVVAAIRDSRTYYGSRVYVDGALKYSIPGKQVSAQFAVPIGVHKLTVQGHDSAGTFSRTVSVSVR